MSGPVNCSSLIVYQAIALYFELEVRRIGVQETISTDQELNHVAALRSVNISGGLVASQENLILNSLRLDVSVIEGVWYDRIYLCHPIILIIINTIWNLHRLQITSKRARIARRD